MTQLLRFEIPHRHGGSEAVNRRFLSWFWVFAITFAVAAFYRPAITAFSVCLPVFVILWTRQLRRAPRPGWVLAVSSDHLAVEGVRRLTVPRHRAATVRFRRRGSAKGSWTELCVLNRSGRILFRTAIDERDRDRIAEALQATGWPLGS